MLLTNKIAQLEADMAAQTEKVSSLRKENLELIEINGRRALENENLDRNAQSAENLGQTLEELNLKLTQRLNDANTEIQDLIQQAGLSKHQLSLALKSFEELKMERAQEAERLINDAQRHYKHLL